MPQKIKGETELSHYSGKIFVLEQEITLNDTVKITEENLHYISNVLRAGVGDKIIVFNNTAFHYLGTITHINKNVANIKIDSIQKINSSNIQIVLLQGIPKSDKLELIIQKSTELGINEIVPISSAHSIKKIMPDKMKRYEKISMEASKQSWRTTIPTISKPVTIEQYLNTLCDNENSLKILFSQDGDKGLKKILTETTSKKIIIAIGPEGDFSNEEKELLQKNGFLKISLGDMILRTETASIIAVGLIQYEKNNL